MKLIIGLIISCIFTYYLFKYSMKIFAPKKYSILQVLSIYEFETRSVEAVEKINKLSHITNIYATMSPQEPPKNEDIKNNIIYDNYVVQDKTSGNGLTYDTRTGEFFVRVALWTKRNG
jgi:uncharacterized protein YacL